jgi:hypothetical protein
MLRSRRRSNKRKRNQLLRLQSLKIKKIRRFINKPKRKEKTQRFDKSYS